MAKGRRVVVGISVPPELRAEMLARKDLNWSKVCRGAIEKALESEFAGPVRALEIRELQAKLAKIARLAGE